EVGQAVDPRHGEVPVAVHAPHDARHGWLGGRPQLVVEDPGSEVEAEEGQDCERSLCPAHPLEAASAGRSPPALEGARSAARAHRSSKSAASSAKVPKKIASCAAGQRATSGPSKEGVVAPMSSTARTSRLIRSRRANAEDG